MGPFIKVLKFFQKKGLEKVQLIGQGPLSPKVQQHRDKLKSQKKFI